MLEATHSTTQLPLDNYKKNQLDTVNTDSTTGNQDKQNLSRKNVHSETDKVSLGYSSESIITYNDSMTLKGVQNDGFDLLRGLVLNMLKEQGIESTLSTGAGEIDLNEISQVEAQALIEKDGYWGVEKTSDRIVEFAIGIAGGDPARLAAIKDGIEQGFQEALEAFGGELPGISYDTYDAVMEKLDSWAGLDYSLQS